MKDGCLLMYVALLAVMSVPMVVEGAIHHSFAESSTMCECDAGDADFYRTLYCLQINDVLGTCPKMNVVDVLTYEGESACGAITEDVAVLEMGLDLALNFQTVQVSFASDKPCLYDPAEPSMRLSYGVAKQCAAEAVDVLPLDPAMMSISFDEATQRNVLAYKPSLLPALTFAGTVVRLRLNTTLAACTPATDPATMSLANYYLPIRPQLDLLCTLGGAANNLFGGGGSSAAPPLRSIGAAASLVVTAAFLMCN